MNKAPGGWARADAMGVVWARQGSLATGKQRRGPCAPIARARPPARGVLQSQVQMMRIIRSLCGLSRHDVGGAVEGLCTQQAGRAYYVVLCSTLRAVGACTRRKWRARATGQEMDEERKRRLWLARRVAVAVCGGVERMMA